MSAGEVDFLKVEEIEEHLKGYDKMEECPDVLVTELAQHLHRYVTRVQCSECSSSFDMPERNGRKIGTTPLQVYHRL